MILMIVTITMIVSATTVRKNHQNHDRHGQKIVLIMVRNPPRGGFGAFLSAKFYMLNKILRLQTI